MIVAVLPAVLLLFHPHAMADPATNAAIQPPFTPPLHDAGLSVLRLIGAFALVIALFFVGIWLFRNWQRVALRHGALARLNVLEAKSLGNRQLLFVVGYDQQRMLVGASPAGITLLALLPESTDGQSELPAPTTGFPATLAGFLTRKFTR